MSQDARRPGIAFVGLISGPVLSHAHGGWAASEAHRRDAQQMLDHLGIQCSDVAVSAAFYDRVLAPLGASRLMEPHEGVIGYGTQTPVFWLGPLSESHTGWREDHIAFTAPDREAVRAFFDAAVVAGAEVLHEPKEWPIYHPGYYGAFVRDPDGNNVEAVCHTAS